jgi:hypothetical protein
MSGQWMMAERIAPLVDVEGWQDTVLFLCASLQDGISRLGIRRFFHFFCLGGGIVIVVVSIKQLIVTLLMVRGKKQ